MRLEKKTENEKMSLFKLLQLCSEYILTFLVGNFTNIVRIMLAVGMCDYHL